MTVESAQMRGVLSVLRMDQPVDDLLDRLDAAEMDPAQPQPKPQTLCLTMWRARDGLAARLRSGAAPAQALTDWSLQTKLDLVALQGARAVTITSATPAVPEDQTRAALSQIFAQTLLNSDRDWRALAETWDAKFESADVSPLPLELIEQAHAELTHLSKTAAQAHLEARLARAGRQAEHRAGAQAAHVARDRETALATALLDRTGAR